MENDINTSPIGIPKTPSQATVKTKVIATATINKIIDIESSFPKPFLPSTN